LTTFPFLLTYVPLVKVFNDGNRGNGLDH